MQKEKVSKIKSEDDTFLQLKRIPFQEVIKKYLEWFNPTNMHFANTEETDAYLRNFGWTYKEFTDTLNRYINDN